MAVRVLWTVSVNRQCSTPIGRTLKYVQNIATMLLHTHTKNLFQTHNPGNRDNALSNNERVA